MPLSDVRAFSVLAFALMGASSVACSPFDTDAPGSDGGPSVDVGSGSDAPATEDTAADDVEGDAPGTVDTGTADDAGDATDAAGLPLFSFFYTSLDAMRRLSGNPNGFGGDLRFGMPTGIEGADKICQTIATEVGFGAKTWRAFLSATRGPDGRTVHAIDRIGEGPWYDRKGRLIARDRLGLLGADRPVGDADTVNDLPDETGQGTSVLGSTYDAITGTNRAGQLYLTDPRNTCMDWTNKSLEAVVIMCGHAWLGTGVGHWIEAHGARSCVPGVNLQSNGTSDGSSIGAGGGWGGFYCFALTP
jgi:hypothetical protein